MDRRCKIRCLGRCLLLIVLSAAGFYGRVPVARAAEGQAALSADSPQALAAAADEHGECRQLAALLAQQQSLISRETGQIKRELAALRADLGKPGLREALAGIGYIFGLAGVACYFHSRRSRMNRDG
jgi:hypothetical protein